MSQKDERHAVIPCPEVSFGEDYFYYCSNLSRVAIFLEFFSLTPINVFFIDNYFRSFKHHNSRFVLWSCGAKVLYVSRLVTKSLKHSRTQKVITFSRNTFFYFFLIFSLRHRGSGAVICVHFKIKINQYSSVFFSSSLIYIYGFFLHKCLNYITSTLASMSYINSLPFLLSLISTKLKRDVSKLKYHYFHYSGF